jgi:hypothetical protein
MFPHPVAHPGSSRLTSTRAELLRTDQLTRNPLVLPRWSGEQQPAPVVLASALWAGRHWGSRLLLPGDGEDFPDARPPSGVQRGGYFMMQILS